MTYQSLYRKYRPRTFEEVVGQKHVVEILKKSLEKDVISHAYLFCGPRATGKTSIAKMFASAINCENGTICGNCENCKQSLNETHSDIIEIDAASNNGVDEIRSIIERVKYAPILGKKKVYIIDEVHMLSQGAFNALLKTLEEPPEHVVFILATTEIHKVLPTIISRCQRYDFLRIDEKDMIKRLDYILENEGAKAEPQVTKLIASVSGGGLRNALTYLEQAIILADEEIKEEDIINSLGMILPQEKINIFKAIRNKDTKGLMDALDIIREKSIQIERILTDILNDVKNAYLLHRTQDTQVFEGNDLTVSKYLRQYFEIKELMIMLDMIKEVISQLRFMTQSDIYFELLMVSLLEKLGISDENRSITEDKEIDKEVIITPMSQTYVDIKKEEPMVEPVETKKSEEGIEEKEDVKLSEPLVEESESIVDLNDKTTDNQITDKTPKPSLINTIEMDDILKLMVSGDKEKRIEEDRLFAEVINYRLDLKWAKISRLLSEGDVVISGDTFTILTFNNDYEVNEVMDSSNYHEIHDFIPLILKQNKHLLAITKKQYQEAVQLFLEHHKNNTLPDKISEDFFNKFIATKTKSATESSERPEDKVNDLFGDKVEIIE